MHKHDYVIVKNDSRSVTEVCSECKKKLITKTDSKGRIDNKAYLKEHSRDTAQPKGATAKVFQKYYGKPKT